MSAYAEIIQFAEKKAEVRRESRSVYRTLHRRAASKAGKLSRLTRAKASCEVIGEAVNALISLCYETYPNGIPANVDAVTGDLLISTPWSSRNYRRFGLKRTEADILRRFMFDAIAAAKKGKLAPLFIYDPDARSWALNRADFPTYESAVAWWKRWALTPQGYQTRLQTLRRKRGKVMQNVRKGRGKP